MHILAIIAQLVFLEGILSIDNAAVLGALASTLPVDKLVPYPESLQFLQNTTKRLLGKQRSAALKVGLLMAYVGRALMLFMASAIQKNPILAAIGALYLIYLAAQNLKQPDAETETAVSARDLSNATFWVVVLQIELTDLALSLDNVVAAVSLSSKLWVVMVGVALGILTMRFAAGIFTWLIEREPIIETAAYIIIFNLGLELLLSTGFHIEIPLYLKFFISTATLLLCLAYAHFPILQPVYPLLRAGQTFFGFIDQVINWMIRPFSVLIRWVIKLIQKPGNPKADPESL